MIRYIIMSILMLGLLTGQAGGVFEDTHSGRVCASCHTIVSCSGTLCHPSNEGSFDFRARHTQPDTCSRCHSTSFAGQNVHLTHDNKVKCETCHNPPENFTSTKAVIPTQDRAGEFILPKSSQCSYCHRVGGSGLHGIHRPVLNGKCQKCHGEGFSPSKADVAKATGKTPPVTIGTGGMKFEVSELILLPIKIISDLFDSIASIWMKILGI